MIESSENHPEFMKELQGVNPAADRLINQDDDWYFADKKHVSNSMLKIFQQSGIKNYDCYLKSELKIKSKALDIGSAFHCLILEPEYFHERFFILDDTEICDSVSGKGWKAKGKKPRSTKGYKDWYADNIQEIEDNPGITIISNEEMNTLKKMEQALSNIPEVVNLIQSCDETETIYYNELNGVKVKSKVDLHKYGQFVGDLKTTSTSVKEFIKSCYKYKYDQQAGFYSDVVNVPRFIFIVVESIYPHNVGVFECSEDFLQRGRDSYQKGLNDLNDYLKNDKFNVNDFYFRETLH